jgi:hypothetical protein
VAIFEGKEKGVCKDCYRQLKKVAEKRNAVLGLKIIDYSWEWCIADLHEQRVMRRNGLSFFKHICPVRDFPSNFTCSEYYMR